jgi:hypothetical protein
VEKLKTFRELGTAYSFCAFLFEVVKFQRCACERKRNQWVSTAQKNPPVDKPAHAGALAAYSTGVGQDIKGQPILSEVGPRLMRGDHHSHNQNREVIVTAEWRALAPP